MFVLPKNFNGKSNFILKSLLEFVNWTRCQYFNNNWIEARNWLLTASERGNLCKRKTKCPDELVRRLLGYTQHPNQVKSLTYGRSNEKKGIKAYVKEASSKRKGICEVLYKGSARES